MSRSRRVTAVWLAVFIAFGGTLPTEVDVRMYMFTWLLIILHFFVDDSSASIPKLLLTIAMALTSLMKFSILCMAAPAMIVIGIESLVRRRPPILPIVYLIAYLVLWMAGSQALGSLPAYLHHSWMIASGYAEGEDFRIATESIDVAIFCVAAVVMFVPILLQKPWRQEKRIRSAFGIVALLGVLFSLFKAGYVRHDGHENIATLSMSLMMLALAAAMWSEAQSQWRRAVLVLLCIGAWMFADWRERKFHHPILSSSIADSLVDFPNRFSEARRWIGDPRLSPRECESYCRLFRGYIMPPVQGSVDVYAYDARWLVAGNWDYDPRPVFQNYVAFTSDVAQLNVDFLNGPRAPQTILWETGTIDQHYAPQEDALSWPILLSRYELTDASWRWLVLRRRSSQTGFTLRPLSNCTAKMNEWIDVPASDDPIWVKIDCPMSWVGKLENFAYKPPDMTLRLRTAQGDSYSFAFMREPAKTGFLLSPLIMDKHGFKQLFAADWKSRMKRICVTQMQIFPRDLSSHGICYPDDLSVEFDALEYAHQDVSKVPGMSR
jgi:hypothetical protein